MKTKILLLGMLFSMGNFSFAQTADYNFTGTDLHGKTYTLYDLLDDGKYVYMCFNYIGNPYGFIEQQNIIYTEFGYNNQDLVVLCIFSANQSDCQTYLDGHQPIYYPILYDGAGGAYNYYSTGSFPDGFFVKPNKQIEYIDPRLSTTIKSRLSDNGVVWNSPYTEQIISNTATAASSVYAIDVDGDGDIDVLSAAKDDDKIAWYENDGSQTFIEHSVSTNADGVLSVFAIDIDSDGDIDILSASWYDNKIAWYENNGSETFTEHSISTNVNGANSVYAIDVDSDGDIDVLSTSYYDDEIVWYENNGSETFTEHIISTNADAALSVFAIDIDSDGDIDVLSASVDDSKIAWYENNGSQTFTEHSISTNADGANSVYAIDVDSDGDIDILSASANDDKIAWYKNSGSESFTEQIISTNINAASSVFAIDIDNDGDIDVLSASSYDHKIELFENDGNESFINQIISDNAMSAKSVFAIDIDNDNHIDILSASGSDSKIAWYKYCMHPSRTISPTVCNNYTATSGAIYSNSGTYLDTIQNVGGCDSVLVINLTVKNAYQQQICMVTVDTLTGENLVVWEPTDDGIAEYIVYRESAVAGIYDELGTVVAGNLTVYVDATANPMSEPNKYKITTKDTCDNYSSIDSCDYHKTIHLQTMLGSPEGYQLNWTEYEGFPYLTYNIYGRETGIGSYTIVHQSAYGNTTWTDGTTAPSMEYRIGVVKAEPCLSTKTSGGPYNQSLSNIDDYSTSISDANHLQTGIYLYPNPCTGIFTVRGEDITKITIIDINGKTILTKENIVEFNNIDISQKSKGVYFVKVTTENSVAIQKLVLE